MDYSCKPTPIKPRIIIHGGAGNITRDNLPPKPYNAYRDTLLKIVRYANGILSRPEATALDVATLAVTMLENDPIFNAGRGAVYTTSGTHELEASIMVSSGYRKRGVGVMKVTTAKNPIRLAREMLVRGQEEDGGGAQAHVQLHGETCDKLAERWGLDQVRPSYYWTRKRWEEHRRGLGLDFDKETYEREKKKADGEVEDVSTVGHCETCKSRGTRCDRVKPRCINCRLRHFSCSYGPARNEVSSGSEDFEDYVGDIGWDGKEYLPQGTVGAVVLDSFGTLCVATSTGGLTNKLPGRIGDTPTLGAGFWAEEWKDGRTALSPGTSLTPSSHLISVLGGCLPGFAGLISMPPAQIGQVSRISSSSRRAVAMSGTGNGDSFLKVNAVRTAAAIARYSSSPAQATGGHNSCVVSLQQAVTAVAGPHGQLQRSAEDRWHKTGEGEGGIIGIELVKGEGQIVYDFNCGGMFHAWIDDYGNERFEVFHDDAPPAYS